MTTMTSSLLAGVELAPRDPILGLTEQFNADKNPRKVNLGIGVYTDDKGKVPLLECVRSAETQMPFECDSIESVRNEGECDPLF